MRRVPIAGARALGTATKWWRGFPILYVAVVFFLIPILLLGISSMFVDGGKGSTTFGAIIVIVLGVLLIKFIWWWFRRDGLQKTKKCFKARQNKREVMNAIPLEWQPLKNDVDRLKDFTGLPDEEEDDIEDKESKLDEDKAAEDVTNNNMLSSDDTAASDDNTPEEDKAVVQESMRDSAASYRA